MIQTTTLGAKAEAYVRNYLEQHRCKIIHQNWRNKFCEIDIVAKDKKTYLFVEVKYRRSSQQGGIESVISADKMRRLRQAVEFWCFEYGISTQSIPIRIDVAFVSGDANHYQLEYVKNAIGIDE